MSNRREHKRFNRRYEANVRTDEKNASGFIVNISHGGMEVQVEDAFKPGDTVEIPLRTRSGKEFRYKSIVIWSEPSKDWSGSDKPVRLGVRHIQWDERHEELLSDAQYDEQRREENRMRIDLLVTITNLPASPMMFTENISAHGIFVRCDEDLPISQDDEIHLRVSDTNMGREIQFVAQVTHVIDKDWAIRTGLIPGFGARVVEEAF